MLRLLVYTVVKNIERLTRAALRGLRPGNDGVFVSLDLAHLDAVLHDLGFLEHLSAVTQVIWFLVKKRERCLLVF